MLYDSEMKATLGIESRQLGLEGPAVYPMGLGCMGMSGMYGPSNESESVATIQAALDARVNLIDTGDFYGMGHNELLIGRAIRDRRDRVVLSVKFGAMRGPDGSWVGIDTRPAAVKNFVTYSLTRLGVDYIDIYRPSRLDPNIPIEDTIGAIADLVQAGYVRYIGLSEVGANTIRRAHATHPICDVQLEYSLVTRGIETAILPVLKELGIAVTGYGVLSRGLLAGSVANGKRDMRAHMPRFAEANRQQNQTVVRQLEELAIAQGINCTQLAIAWVLNKQPTVVPVLGARTTRQLNEAMGALAIRMTSDEIAQIEAAIPATAIGGTRYPELQMKLLDSERT